MIRQPQGIPRHTMSALGPFWTIIGVAVVLVGAFEALSMAGFQNALFMVVQASLTSAAVLLVVSSGE